MARVPHERTHLEVLDRLLFAAFDEAQRLGHGWVGPEHWLLAVLSSPAPSAAVTVLADLGLTHDRFAQALQRASRGPIRRSIPTTGVAEGRAPHRTSCSGAPRDWRPGSGRRA